MYVEEDLFFKIISWTARKYVCMCNNFEFCHNVVFLFYRATNKAQKATQEKAFSKPRIMPNERCLFQKYEMAGCNKS